MSDFGGMFFFVVDGGWECVFVFVNWFEIVCCVISFGGLEMLVEYCVLIEGEVI